MAKVIYFIASEQPTAPELADIATLTARGDDVLVRTRVGRTTFGDKIEPSDEVAGRVPAAYSSVARASGVTSTDDVTPEPSLSRMYKTPPPRPNEDWEGNGAFGGVGGNSWNDLGVSNLSFMSGSYVGDGQGVRTIDTDFVPHTVMVWGDGVELRWKNRTSWHGRSQCLHAENSSYVIGAKNGNIWDAFYTDGFTLIEAYNALGVEYQWCAWYDADHNVIDETSIIGTGSNGRVIEFSEFDPGLVWAKRDSTRASVWSLPGDVPQRADNLGPLPGSIGINGNQLTLSDSVWVNENNPPALGEGIEYFAFNPGDDVTVFEYVGNGASQTFPINAATVFVLDKDRTNGTPLVVSNGGPAYRCEGTGNEGSIQIGSDVTVGPELSESGVSYLILGINGSQPANQTYPIPTRAGRVSNVPGVLSTGLAFGAGATSYEFYGKPYDLLPDFYRPLLMAGAGDDAEPSVRDKYNAGLYTYETDPDSNGWRGGVLRFLNSDYLARERTGLTINTYNTNTGIIINPGQPVHIVVTHNGTGSWRVYVDGVLVKLHDVPVTVNGGAGIPKPLYAFFSDLENSNIQGAGDVYKVQVWNRELDPLEAYQLFTSRNTSATTGDFSKWFGDGLPTGVTGFTNVLASDPFVPSLLWFAGTDANSSGEPITQPNGDVRFGSPTIQNGRAYTPINPSTDYSYFFEIDLQTVTRVLVRASDTDGNAGDTLEDVSGSGIVTLSGTFSSGVHNSLHVIPVAPAANYLLLRNGATVTIT